MTTVKRKGLKMSKSSDLCKKHASSGQFLKIEDGGQVEAVYVGAEDAPSNFDRTKTNVRYRLKIDGVEKWLESGSRHLSEQMARYEEGDTIIIKRVGQFKDTTYTVEKAV